MIFLLALLGIPCAYLIVILWLVIIKRDARGLGLSLFFFSASVATGVWAILQSRSSTAGIGFLGIPLLGGLAVNRLKKGTPPVPEQAIREAKLTTEALKSNGR